MIIACSINIFRQLAQVTACHSQYEPAIPSYGTRTHLVCRRLSWPRVQATAGRNGPDHRLSLGSISQRVSNFIPGPPEVLRQGQGEAGSQHPLPTAGVAHRHIHLVLLVVG